jgi:predicted ester cyclase
MSAKDNKEAVRRTVEEAINKGDLDVIDEVMDAGYVYHVPDNEVVSPDGFKLYVSMMRAALPDLKMTIEDMVAEGDTVASRFTIKGTHHGHFMGVAPTGKKVEISEAVFIRFRNGKEVEAWPYTDTLSIYQQLGVSNP